MTGAIQKAAEKKQLDGKREKQTLNTMLNTMLDKEGMRKRFEELLGNRTPQFMSSIVSLINADTNLQEAFYQSPMTIIQAALKAAIFDLPIDPNLGFAYIVAFNNKKPDGSKAKEASFIMGYKGMQQLALRSGAYKTLNVVDIREGELKSYNRLTEDIEVDFVEDDGERDRRPIVGYVGYFRLINGTEKTIYMSKKQIDNHEKKHRKGQYMGKGWREDYEAMCAKTVMRKLIGKWGLMSINYQQADAKTIAAAEAVAAGQFDDEDPQGEYIPIELEPQGEDDAKAHDENQTIIGEAG